MEYLLIFISAIFVNNIVLSQFLGICPFLGVSKKIDTAIGMGGAIAFVLTLATIITWCVQDKSNGTTHTDGCINFLRYAQEWTDTEKLRQDDVVDEYRRDKYQ